MSLSETICKLLKLSEKDRSSISGTATRLKTISEFLKDIADVSKNQKISDVLGEHCPWWLGAVGESLSSAVPVIRFVSTLMKELSKIRDPDQLAYLAVTIAYERSVEEALRSAKPPASKAKARKSWAPADSDTIPGSQYDFRTFSLERPFSHPCLVSAQEDLCGALAAAGYTEAQVRLIHADIENRFPSILKALLAHPDTREQFAPFTSQLALGGNELRAMQAWEDHFAYQRFLFDEKPVFSEEGFPLSAVYVDCECGILDWGMLNKADPVGIGSLDGRVDAFDERNGGRHDTLKTVMSHIQDPRFHEAIVIQGSAGAGKSSLTLRLCKELQSEGFYPIRVRFRDIPAHLNSIEDALPYAVSFWDVDDATHPPLPCMREELFSEALFDQSIPGGQICRWVLILDGWDELDGANRGYAIRIDALLTELRGWLLHPNRHPKVRVILTGRPNDAVAGHPFLRQGTKILTLRPLSPIALETFVCDVADRLATTDPGLVTPKKRFAPVLKKYTAEFSLRSSPNVDIEKQTPTMDVLGAPLLAHLSVRLMVTWPGDDLASLVQNPTTLYRHLTDLTCDKGGRYGKDTFVSVFHGAELRRMLQLAAVAMTTSRKEVISCEELEHRLEQLDAPRCERVRVVTGQSVSQALMLNFFFKGGRKEFGTEFLHKSFREYLFAESIVAVLKDFADAEDANKWSRTNYWDDFSPDDPRYRLSRRLMMYFGPNWMSPEVLRFLEGLLTWELGRAHDNASEGSSNLSTHPRLLSEWTRIRDALAELWAWWGEGVHMRRRPRKRGTKHEGWDPPPVEETLNWIEGSPDPRMNTIDSHLGDALFRLNAWIHYKVAVPSNCDPDWTKVSLTTESHSGHDYQRTFKYDGGIVVRFAPSGCVGSYFGFYVARITAAGWRPFGPFPSSVNMDGVVLDKTLLDGLNFARVSAKNASMVKASVFETSFLKCDLQRVDLRGARFCCGTLRATIMTGARFDKATLVEAGRDVEILARIDGERGKDEDAVWRVDPLDRKSRQK